MSNHEVAPMGGNAPALPQALSIQQRNQVQGSGANAEMQRVLAEVQAQIYLAKQFPRNPVEARQRIFQACESLSLAKDATYSFSRGGTDIAGASIDLLTVIASNWGNIDFGAKEIARRPAHGSRPGESDVLVFAKDLETNTTRRMEFVVTHVRDTRQGSKPLTDERDIYENIANQAARRMRRCMEDIIPRDVVDDAVEQCRRTVVAKADVNEETIKKLVDAFAKMGVSKAQIEKRIQRKVEAMQPATYVKMREIYKSINDGMSEVGDWFEVVTVAGVAVPVVEGDTTTQAKEALATKAEQSSEAKAEAETTAVDDTDVAETQAEGQGQTTEMFKE